MDIFRVGMVLQRLPNNELEEPRKLPALFMINRNPILVLSIPLPLALQPLSIHVLGHPCQGHPQIVFIGI